ncbi:hypothetical protein CBR_g31323 [Chara braunii]|uniref:Uncharacterized protein n=1 Tax=Chara braunii TaxID=69332 RepID=A0A388LEM8_CHABU|nr:hypothetical protein CBR_g31323 [Chara braunii]|eukprot:GBG80769.1 hypothetical protein CBR_g31323 [Chara braunii]
MVGLYNCYKAGWSGGRVPGWSAARLVGWSGGGMGGWEDGRMGGWQNGGMARWEDGRAAGWQHGRVAGWQDGRTVGSSGEARPSYGGVSRCSPTIGWWGAALKPHHRMVGCLIEARPSDGAVQRHGDGEMVEWVYYPTSEGTGFRFRVQVCLVGWHDGWTVKWSDGRIVKLLEGGMVGWSGGRMVSCPAGRIVGWWDGRMGGWEDGRMAEWKDGKMVGQQDGRMAGLQDGRMAGLQDGRMAGWSGRAVKLNDRVSALVEEWKDERPEFEKQEDWKRQLKTSCLNYWEKQLDMLNKLEQEKTSQLVLLSTSFWPTPMTESVEEVKVELPIVDSSPRKQCFVGYKSDAPKPEFDLAKHADISSFVVMHAPDENADKEVSFWVGRVQEKSENSEQILIEYSRPQGKETDMCKLYEDAWNKTWRIENESSPG